LIAEDIKSSAEKQAEIFHLKNERRWHRPGEQKEAAREVEQKEEREKNKTWSQKEREFRGQGKKEQNCHKKRKKEKNKKKKRKWKKGKRDTFRRLLRRRTHLSFHVFDLR